jgi:hypothetical protein
MLTLPRGSAHEIEFAVQIRKKAGACIWLFTLLEEESFDHREELSDDFGTVCGPFLLVGETVVSRQPDSGTESCSVPLYALYIV